MDVKEAVRIALDYVVDLFGKEDLTHVGLEEVQYYHSDEVDGFVWQVTVGFSRPWDYPSGGLGALSITKPARSLKVVRISDESGRVLSLLNPGS